MDVNILIIGGAGMVGQKLAHSIAGGGLGNVSVDRLVLYDIVEARKPEAPFAVETMTGNFADPSEARRLAALKADLVFHLAAIVSGEAETDFDKGWDINARGSWHLLEALRKEHEADGGVYRPKMVFTSSIAVFGSPYPDKIGDEFLSAPQSSYGAQKAITELLVSDYSRKGMIDGISIRLPTIVVRPGKANLAASSFFSGIIREPLNGKEAILPVDDDVRHWHASPRSAAGFLTHAAALDTVLLKGRRSLNMPGVSCTVAEQIEALRKVAGDDAVRLIRRQPDDMIMRMVGSWPRDFDPGRALDLGFRAEKNFEEIIQVYLEDDLIKHQSGCAAGHLQKRFIQFVQSNTRKYPRNLMGKTNSGYIQFLHSRLQRIGERIIMKLVSYNIQYGLGADGRNDIARVAEEVRDADIIALQEVERFWKRSGNVDQPEALAGLLRDHYWVFAANLDMDGSFRDQKGRVINRRRQFGTMILSRYPIISTRNFPLPKYATITQHSIQQGLLEAVIDPGTGPLRVYSVHLSHLSTETRLPQIRAMQDIIKRAPSEGGAWCGGHPDPAAGWTEGDMPPMPRDVIVMGDMNFNNDSIEYEALVGPYSEAYGRLMNADGMVDAWVAAGHDEFDGTSHPTGGRIDYCFVSASLADKVSAVWVNGAAKGSDHWPVWVEMD